MYRSPFRNYKFCVADPWETNNIDRLIRATNCNTTLAKTLARSATKDRFTDAALRAVNRRNESEATVYVPLLSPPGRSVQSLVLSLRQPQKPTKGKARQASDSVAGSGVEEMPPPPPPPPLAGAKVTKALRLPELTTPGGPGGV